MLTTNFYSDQKIKWFIYENLLFLSFRDLVVSLIWYLQPEHHTVNLCHLTVEKKIVEIEWGDKQMVRGRKRKKQTDGGWRKETNRWWVEERNKLMVGGGKKQTDGGRRKETKWWWAEERNKMMVGGGKKQTDGGRRKETNWWWAEERNKLMVVPLQARVNLGAMAIKRYSSFPKALVLLEPYHI